MAVLSWQSPFNCADVFSFVVRMDADRSARWNRLTLPVGFTLIIESQSVNTSPSVGSSKDGFRVYTQLFAKSIYPGDEKEFLYTLICVYVQVLY